ARPAWPPRRPRRRPPCRPGPSSPTPPGPPPLSPAPAPWPGCGPVLVVLPPSWARHLPLRSTRATGADRAAVSVVRGGRLRRRLLPRAPHGTEGEGSAPPGRVLPGPDHAPGGGPDLRRRTRPSVDAAGARPAPASPRPCHLLHDR